jgi:hypothetical protein
MGVEHLYVVSGIIRRFFSRRRYSGIHGSKCQNATFPSARNTATIATSRSILLYIGAGLARRSIEVGDAASLALQASPCQHIPTPAWLAARAAIRSVATLGYGFVRKSPLSLSTSLD